MSDNSAIEWTDATWNPVTGCTEVSPGCDHCYAKTFAERWRGTPGHHFEQGFDVVLRPERLDQPLKWKKPRRVFVNSMSDLFHEAIPDLFITQVFDVMEQAREHTFQVLTKRHARMRSFVTKREQGRQEYADKFDHCPTEAMRASPAAEWARQRAATPPANIWLGVSVEDQKWADIRIPALLETPAAVRWISAEPLLGPVVLRDDWIGVDPYRRDEPALSWLVAGGESGPGARPMHPDWARGLRDQCTSASVPFFFKQWGEWAPNGWRGIGIARGVAGRERLVGPVLDDMGHRQVIERLGKKRAGRELDGRTWDEYPG